MSGITPRISGLYDIRILIPYTTLFPFISTNEWKRAQGFNQSSDTRKYILRHGLLRFIMEELTGNEPGQLTIKEGENSKPLCNSHQTSYDITFSLSSTRETLCIGATLPRAIGIDLIKPDSQYLFREVMDSFFLLEERDRGRERNAVFRVLPDPGIERDLLQSRWRHRKNDERYRCPGSYQ